MRLKLLQQFLLIIALSVCCTDLLFAQRIGDNLGNHQAKENLRLNGYQVLNTSGIAIGTAVFTNNSVAIEIAGNKAIKVTSVADTSAITAPLNGMMVYHTTSNKFYVREGGKWNRLSVSVANDGTETKVVYPAYAKTLNSAANFVDTAKFKYTPSTGTLSSRRLGIGTAVINTGSNSAAFGQSTTASGINAAAFGASTNASALNAVTFGQNTTASGTGNSAAFGQGTTASGARSTAFGTTTRSSGTNSLTSGFNAVATGDNSLSVGDSTVAQGTRAVAFNHNTKSNGTNTATFGYSTLATGDNAAAFGNGTKATSPTAMAFGYYTEANGNESVAFGYQTKANGNNSVAFGRGSTATASRSFVMGSYLTGAHTGSFLIGDEGPTSLSSTANNQFSARFAGGYRFSTDDGGYTFSSTTGGYNFNSTTGGYNFNSTTGGYNFNSTTGGYNFTSTNGGTYIFQTTSGGFDFRTSTGGLRFATNHPQADVKGINILAVTGNVTSASSTKTETLSGFSADIVSTSTNRDITASDNGKIIVVSGTAATTLTVRAVPKGFNCMVVQSGTGIVTIASNGSSVANRSNYNKTAGTNAVLTILAIDTNVCITSGDMQ